jgi:hypothetical protein
MCISNFIDDDTPYESNNSKIDSKTSKSEVSKGNSGNPSEHSDKQSDTSEPLDENDEEGVITTESMNTEMLANLNSNMSSNLNSNISRSDDGAGYGSNNYDTIREFQPKKSNNAFDSNGMKF